MILINDFNQVDLNRQPWFVSNANQYIGYWDAIGIGNPLAIANSLTSPLTFVTDTDSVNDSDSAVTVNTVSVIGRHSQPQPQAQTQTQSLILSLTLCL